MSTSQEHKKPKYRRNQFSEYSVVNQDYSKQLGKLTKLTTIRTILFLVQNNHNWNTVRLKGIDISIALSINKGNVSRSIKELIEKDFIVELRNKKGFRLNPYLVWCGSNKNHYLAQRQWDKIT